MSLTPRRGAPGANRGCSETSQLLALGSYRCGEDRTTLRTHQPAMMAASDRRPGMMPRGRVTGSVLSIVNFLRSSALESQLDTLPACLRSLRDLLRLDRGPQNAD